MGIENVSVWDAKTPPPVGLLLLVRPASRADANRCLTTSMVALSRTCRASDVVALGRTVAACGLTCWSCCCLESVPVAVPDDVVVWVFVFSMLLLLSASAFLLVAFVGGG